jgi:2,4-dienoyl-CoA reductase-like NADH-dependent reductase (Old Yellow Enzyme family)/thioredoxin reductase
MLELKNKFILAPVKTGYSNGTGIITNKHLKFYELRAKYLGAVIPEPLYLDKGLRELPTQIGIDSDDKINGLKKLTELIHKYDTKVIAHLNHPGRMANPKIPGNYFISSTDKACESGGAAPKRMDKEEIAQAVQLFADAAKRAEQSGFDIIELQFGHGYLAAQFLSPLVNNRDDEYGGSFENRIRFPLQILEAVRHACLLPVIVRISGNEMIEGGIALDEMIKFAKILKEKSVEAVHVSAGTVCSTPPWYFQHMFVPKGKTWEFAKQIKEKAGIDTIYVGQINTADDLNILLSEFKSDYISVGRALVADPDFIGKYINKVRGNIRPCLACSEGCLGGVKSGKGLQCMVNPKVGKEDVVYEEADTSKKYAVIGGGLAGMEAALTLTERGHDVTLFEEDKLGGQFNLAYLPPHKQTLKKILDFYFKEIEEKNIKLNMTHPEKENLSDYDGVIIATGAVPTVPPIEGLHNYYWAEVLEEKHLPAGKRVAVIGGGLIGTEVANKLLAKGNEVFIIEMFSEIARGMEMIERKLTLKAFKNSKIKIYVNSIVKKIENDKVIFESNGETFTINDINLIVMATGMKSNNPYADINLGKPTYVIGDASKPAKAQDAIRSAFETAMML